MFGCSGTRFSWLLVLVLALSLGCGKKDQGQGSDAKVPNVKPVDGVLKVLVQSNGTILVNGQAVSTKNLDAVISGSGKVNEIWYFRETPDDESAGAASIKVLSTIENRGLPLVMYLDADFKVPADAIW